MRVAAHADRRVVRDGGRQRAQAEDGVIVTAADRSSSTPRKTPGTVIAAVVLLIVGGVALSAFGLFYLIGGIIDLGSGISGTPVALTVTVIGAVLCALACGLIVPAAALLRGSVRARNAATLCAAVGIVFALVGTVLALGAGNLLPVGLLAEAAILSVGLSLLRSPRNTSLHFVR